MSRATQRDDDRWRGRPLQSLLLRAVMLLGPVVASVLTAIGVTAVLPEPGSVVMLAAWWVVVTAVSMGVLLVADRFARRLLPLAALLKMTMLFPDAAPKRYAVARKAGGVTDLEQRLEEARHQGVGGDAVQAAERILVLVTALAHHDRRTRGHSERTHLYTDLLARQMELPEKDRDRLRWAALVHDIGKLEVPEGILNKPDRPDEAEWAILREHPDHGARICEPLQEWLGPWWDAIGQHHERWDGRGYPRALAGTDISLAARIVSVADSYEVMTANRPYHHAMSHVEARQELVRCAGTQFDPAVVRAFLAISLRKVRFLAGPLSWFGQIPVLRTVLDVIPRLQGAGLVAAQSAAVAAAAGATVVTLGGLPETAPQVPPVAADVAPQVQVEHAVEERPMSPQRPTADRPESAPPADGVIAAGPAPVAPLEEPASPAAPAQPVTPPSGPPPGPQTDAVPAPAPGPAPSPPASAAPEDADSPPGDAIVQPTPAPTPGRSPEPAREPEPAPEPATEPEPEPAAPSEPPVARNPVRTMDADTTLVVTLAELAQDPDGDLDPTRLRVTDHPAHGTALVHDDAIHHTPTAGWFGTDTLGYAVCDRTSRCVEGTLHLTVVWPRPLPEAVPVELTTRRGDPVEVDVLLASAEEGVTASIATQPADGQALVLENGHLRYTPDASFVGTDSFDYALCDGPYACTQAPVTVTVALVAPIAVDDTAGTPEDTAVTIDVGGNDVAGTAALDHATLTVTEEPRRGHTAAEPGGALRYTPARDLHGEDAFTYEICDLDGLCDSAVVTVVVEPVNDAPVAIGDEASATAGVQAAIPALDNDYDVEDDSLHIVLEDVPAGTTISVDGDLVLFTADGAAVYSFTYRACDPEDCSAPVTVAVTVTAAPEEGEGEGVSDTYPVAVSDSATTYPNKSVAIPVLDNDTRTDAEGNDLPVTLQIAQAPALGSAEVQGESITYTPGGTDAALGQHTFTYEVCFAGTDRCSFGTVYVTVVREPIPAPEPAPDPPPQPTAGAAQTSGAPPADVVVAHDAAAPNAPAKPAAAVAPDQPTAPIPQPDEAPADARPPATEAPRIEEEEAEEGVDEDEAAPEPAEPPPPAERSRGDAPAVDARTSQDQPVSR